MRPDGGGVVRLTGVQDFDDGGGALDVQGQGVEPAVLHQEEEHAQTVLQGGVGLGLPAARLVRVVLRPEPGPGGRAGGGRGLGRAS